MNGSQHEWQQINEPKITLRKWYITGGQYLKSEIDITIP